MQRSTHHPIPPLSPSLTHAVRAKQQLVHTGERYNEWMGACVRGVRDTHTAEHRHARGGRGRERDG
jgi:hypothetical protein